jgi:hypothetical protein
VQVQQEIAAVNTGVDRLMNTFISAIRSGDENLLFTGVNEILESHLIVFAAEKSRL